MRATFWLNGITILLLTAERCLGQCQDLDTQSCETLFQRDPSLCQDAHFSSTMCPRFCNRCPLNCYHCETPIDSPEQCKTTRACGVGELCMMLHTTTTSGGQHSYEMNCATATFCDGSALLAVGKRGLRTRNINIECCAKDLCNKPVDISATTTSITITATTTTTAATTTMTTTSTTKTMPTTIDRCTEDVECAFLQCPLHNTYKCDRRHHHCKCEPA